MRRSRHAPLHTPPAASRAVDAAIHASPPIVITLTAPQTSSLTHTPSSAPCLPCETPRVPTGIVLGFRRTQTLRLYDARQNLSKRVIPSKMAQLDCCFKDSAATGFCGGLDKQVKQ